MPSVGIISCGKHWKNGCPGIGSHVLCFDAISQQHGPLGNLPEATIVSFDYCQACPGDSIPLIAQKMVQQEGVEVVALASCLFMGEPCPYVRETISRIKSSVTCQLLTGTYFEPELASQHTPDAVRVETRPFGLNRYFQAAVKSVASSR
ncbi:hypothetical protein SY88_01740 [Clostridiales bacterium PH28_bin88]|nr:hypothetical protein SY88_01740 [Clostridiales bacterium PH28_bin88]